jgi:diguanylate cyclase (GGDEF)-like protein
MQHWRHAPGIVDGLGFESAVAERARSAAPDHKRLRRACLLVYTGLVLTLSALFASAPSAASNVEPYRTLQQWTAADGLEQNTVHALARDRRGYVWAGTVDGLTRFDGVRFRTFRLIDDPALGSNRIRALATASDGALWIGTDLRGVVRRIGGRFQALPICDQSCQIDALAAGRRGAMWVLAGRWLYRVPVASPEAAVRIEAGAGRAGSRHLVPLPRGGVVLSAGSSVVRFDASGRPLDRAELPNGEPVRGLALLGGRPLVATRDALLRLAPEGWSRSESTPESVASGDDAIVSLHADDDARIVHLDSGAVLRILDSGALEPIALPAPISVLEVMSGKRGEIWLGSRISGLFRVSPSTMFVGGGYRDAAGGSVLPIIDHPDGGVLVGRLCGGIDHITPDGLKRPVRPARGGKLEHCIGSLLLDADGSIVIGSTGGSVQRLSGDRLENLRAPRAGAGNAELRTNFLLRDPADSVWLGADRGLFRVAGDRIEPVAGSAPHGPMRAAAPRPDGGLLIGTGSGLVEFSGASFRRIETGTWLDDLSVRSILREDERTLWFGTYGGGLWRLRDGEWFHATPGHGLVEDVVSCMLVDRSGVLWTSGNHGLTRVSLAELNALADGRVNRVRASALGIDDGMPNPETNGGGQPACHADERGWFWFPTVAGPIAFDPLAVDEFEPDGDLLIESAALDGTPLQVDGRRLELPAGARNLEIRFTVPQFENPQRLRFRYRLAGVDERWLEAGESRSAQFPVIPSGEFRFEVQLGADDGRWLLRTAALQISVPERGLQVGPMPLLLVAAALLGLLVFFRWRIAGLRRRDAELNRLIEERTRRLSEMNVRLDEMSRTDEITGIANHRRLRHFLRDQWRACLADAAPLTAVLIDVDRFKRFNDTFGHQAGDRFLRAMAQSLSARVRGEGGLLARYGGEEFVAVLPRRTLHEGMDIAEGLRQAVISLEFRKPDGEPGFTTASFGVASTVPTADAAPEELIQRADRAMYRAKRAGRDRVVAASKND